MALNVARLLPHQALKLRVRPAVYCEDSGYQRSRRSLTPRVRQTNEPFRGRR